uniref:KIND domain-containing protein n=1 Tax=Leptobrachium leishanense TaxID=445787 RepID=A0A8C5QQ59_9ANUR
MDEVDFSGEKHIVPLKDILEVYKQPVTEEQAYALCYQCCCKLMNLAWDHQPVPELNGVENLLLRVDGMVSFASSGGTWEDNHSVKEILKCLGHILYTALDWGLTEELERDLTEPMTDMLCSMLGFETVSNSSAIDFQHSVTLDEIKQICAERLFLPGQASIHYQTVCRTYFAEHLEFKKLLATINQRKQSLELLEMDDFMKKDPLPRCTSWGDLWRKVVKELRLGIRLRCVKDRSYIGLTVVHTLTAHQRLMRDIRSRRYTLRKVKASERTLRERTPEEPSLHELLMTEIKSSTKLRLASSPKSKDSEQDADFMLSERLFGTQISDSGLGVGARRERSHWSSSDLLDDGSEVKIIWQADSNPDSDSKLSDIADLTFFPVLTSSQVDLKINSFLNNKARSFIHKRSSSQGYFQKIGTGGKPNKQSNFQRSLPLTIEELVLARQATVKMEISDFLGSNGCSEHRVCFSCHKKRFFFSWPYTCKMCERVNCHECSIEMSMPFKQCMHLPISFFKSLVLTQEDDPDCKANKCTTFYKETLNWDSSTIPLVFEPKGLTEEVPSHKKSMRNWTCMDICIKCEEYLLDILDKSQLVELPVCGLKGRSASVS